MVHVAIAAGAFVACSAAMAEAIALARRLAPLPRPIAVVGETGVGKRLLAQFVHAHSGRAGPFVTVHGAEVSDSMQPPLTGDDRRASGPGPARLRATFERAQNGTLFLADLPLWPRATQSAVLPALRWWIGEFVIPVPPLRGRFVDIAALSYHFLDRAQAEFGGSVPMVLEPEALDRLLTYRWPGNVRQLRGAVEWSWVQAAASAVDRIRIVDLPPPVVRDDTAAVAVDLEARRELSRWAFERAGGNRKRAAQLLGVHPNTIDNHRRAAAP